MAKNTRKPDNVNKYFNFCLQVVHSTTITLNTTNSVDIRSRQTVHTNLYTALSSPSDTLPGQIEQPSPSLSIVRGHVPDPFVARVLARLSEAELKAPIGRREDIRIAWIAVLKADEGHPTPFVQAFFQYFGVSPEKMIPFLTARAELDQIYAQTQAAWLEKYLPFRHHDGWRETFARIQERMIFEHDLTALPPKKSSGSVPLPAERKRVA